MSIVDQFAEVARRAAAREKAEEEARVLAEPPVSSRHPGLPVLPVLEGVSDYRRRATLYVETLITTYEYMRRGHYGMKKVGLTSQLEVLRAEQRRMLSGTEGGDELCRRWAFLVGDLSERRPNPALGGL